MKLKIFRSLISCLPLLFFFNPHVFADVNRAEIDVVQISWQGSSFGKVSPNSLLESLKTEVLPRWDKLSESSSSIEARIKLTLNYDVTSLKLDFSPACSGSLLSNNMSRVRSAYYGTKLSSSQNRILIALVPRTSCVWEGVSLLNNVNEIAGIIFLQDTVSAQVTSHELGHIFGLGHTNLLTCPRNSYDGEWDKGCMGVEYGGGIDLMSNIDVHIPFAIYHQWKLGFVSDEQIEQVQSSVVTRIFDVGSSSGKKGIFFRTKSRAYWIEYRNASSAFPYESGLVLYRTDPPPTGASIISPNPNDQSKFSGDPGLSSDIWMLNLDNFQYLDGRVSGSMSLKTGKPFQIEESGITVLLKSSDENSAIVDISVAERRIPLPKPKLISQDNWRDSNLDIVSDDYSLQNTAISGFEVYINAKLWRVISSRINKEAKRLYLDPLNRRASITSEDLPEGRYKMSIRAQDIWGNLSDFSNEISVQIDRGSPKVEQGLEVLSFDGNTIETNFIGISDAGSQLCQTRLINSLGFALQTSAKSSSPNFFFPVNREVNSVIEATDCSGNGKRALFRFKSELLKIDKVKKIGNWSVSKRGDLEQTFHCLGKCSLFVTVKDSLSLVGLDRPMDIQYQGKELKAKYLPKEQIQNLSWIGPTSSRLIRLTGRNFQIKSVIRSEVLFKDTKEIKGNLDFLEEASSDAFYNLGFRNKDWTDQWRVSPIPKGTTLDDPTLDFCATNYSSESGRIKRLQVAVSKPDSPYLFLSSEIVRYLSESSARDAFKELTQKVSECQRNEGFRQTNGVFQRFVFLSSVESVEKEDSKIKRLVIFARFGFEDNPRTLLAYYQFSGDLFAGLYIVKTGALEISSVERNSWNEVADVLLSRILAQSS